MTPSLWNFNVNKRYLNELINVGADKMFDIFREAVVNIAALVIEYKVHLWLRNKGNTCWTNIGKWGNRKMKFWV